MNRSIRRTACAGVIIALAAACEPGSVADSTSSEGGPTGPPPPGGGGSVQRGAVTVRVSIPPDDASIAAAAGVTVAGLTVRLTRDRATDPPREALTDASGRVSFSGLLQGQYQVSVERALTAEDIARLAPADRDASVFAGGAAFAFTPPDRTLEIDLVAARRGTLVISEFFLHYVLVAGAGAFGKYLEVYNNADTTIYLDGMIVFESDIAISADHSVYGCDPLASLRLDPDNVWSRQIERFPGTGREYPIQPGEAKVIAIDAVDHRPISESLLDLRDAHFERIGGSSDPNNPFSADMVPFRSGGPFHGAEITVGRLHGVALPIARAWTDLVRQDVSLSGAAGTFFELAAIPRSAILDFAAISSTPETRISDPCEPPWSPLFDRAAAPISDWRNPLAIARKSLGRRPDGREILQRTRNSARDFELASPLRRSLQRPR